MGMDVGVGRRSLVGSCVMYLYVSDMYGTRLHTHSDVRYQQVMYQYISATIYMDLGGCDDRGVSLAGTYC